MSQKEGVQAEQKYKLRQDERIRARRERVGELYNGLPEDLKTVVKDLVSKTVRDYDESKPPYNQEWGDLGDFCIILSNCAFDALREGFVTEQTAANLEAQKKDPRYLIAKLWQDDAMRRHTRISEGREIIGTAHITDLYLFLRLFHQGYPSPEPARHPHEWREKIAYLKSVNDLPSFNYDEPNIANAKLAAAKVFLISYLSSEELNELVKLIDLLKPTTIDQRELNAISKTLVNPASVEDLIAKLNQAIHDTEILKKTQTDNDSILSQGIMRFWGKNGSIHG